MVYLTDERKTPGAQKLRFGINIETGTGVYQWHLRIKRANSSIDTQVDSYRSKISDALVNFTDWRQTVEVFDLVQDAYQKWDNIPGIIAQEKPSPRQRRRTLIALVDKFFPGFKMMLANYPNKVIVNPSDLLDKTTIRGMVEEMVQDKKLDFAGSTPPPKSSQVLLSKVSKQQLPNKNGKPCNHEHAMISKFGSKDSQPNMRELLSQIGQLKQQLLQAYKHRGGDDRNNDRGSGRGRNRENDRVCSKLFLLVWPVTVLKETTASTTLWLIPVPPRDIS